MLTLAAREVGDVWLELPGLAVENGAAAGLPGELLGELLEVLVEPVGVSPALTQPVKAVRAAGQVTC